MIKYKVTDQDLRTRQGYQYQVGIPSRVTGFEPPYRLCSSDYLHYFHHLGFARVTCGFYCSPYINPDDDRMPQFWVCETAGYEENTWDKGGCQELTLLQKLSCSLPTPTTFNRIILRALQLIAEPGMERSLVDYALEKVDYACEKGCYPRVLIPASLDRTKSYIPQLIKDMFFQPGNWNTQSCRAYSALAQLNHAVRAFTIVDDELARQDGARTVIENPESTACQPHDDCETTG